MINAQTQRPPEERTLFLRASSVLDVELWSLLPIQYIKMHVEPLDLQI